MASASGKQKSLATVLIAGGSAGFMEAMVCHPLDTIKVRMQLRGHHKSGSPGTVAAVRLGFWGTGVKIVKKEGFPALYKGLGAVVSGIVPKMAIRYSSVQFYMSLLADKTTGKPSAGATFLAGLGAGITESILVVTPMDVIKIRLQAQRHSLSDPLDVPKYRSPAHAVYTIVREEGFGALYKGLALTCLRQATNQAVNFTVYNELKRRIENYQGKDLTSWQPAILGGISGAMGPLSNAPIDVIKTRIQRTPSKPGEGSWTRFVGLTSSMIKNEGYSSFYKGLTPRLLRVAPGNAVTFTVYEFVAKRIELLKLNWQQAEEQINREANEY